jgi:hypothetical protein
MYQNSLPSSAPLVDRYECHVRDADWTWQGQDAYCFSPSYDAPRDPKKDYLDPVESESAICDLQSKNL